MSRPLARGLRIQASNAEICPVVRVHRKNFSFKCHRLPDAPKAGEQVSVHSECHQISREAARPPSDIFLAFPPFLLAPSGVNAMAFHRQFGTFATAGGDGRISFWDHENRSKLKSTLDHPLAATSLEAETDCVPLDLISPRRRFSAKPTDRLHPHSDHVSRLQPHAHAPRCRHVVRLEQRPRRKHAPDADEGPTAHRQA